MNPQKQLHRPEIMVCPLCRAEELDWPEDAPAGCRQCGASFPLHDGWPLLLCQNLMEKAIAGWGAAAAIYNTYEPSCGFPLIDRPLLDSCHGDVLDVGCGDGRMMRLADQRCRTLTGIDPVPAMTSLARQAGFSVLTAAAENLPFADTSFDQVISGWASMRYTDYDLSFPEVSRVLRPGGSFTFTLWNFHIQLLMEKIGLLIRGRKDSTAYLEYFRDRDVSSINRLMKRLAAAGLPVQTIRSTLFPSRLARALYPVIRYYRGRLGTRLGYHVILSCRKSEP